ncbi:MAG TPA: LuxR C-terminal-related transcriptional regulator [Vicinamibacterales bacterium]|nr:LuxR C-terminal-related transcriptional regulator [Vicinamibacterales bacterium]
MDHLEHGRECYAHRAWADAYHALLRADHTAALDVDDLDRLATAAYLMGRDLEFQHIVARLYGVHVASGDRPRAARCAFWLALTFLLRGDAGQSNAWTARGQRLVEDRDCAEAGYLSIAVAEQQLRDGREGEAFTTAGRAAAIGESCRDTDLTAAARHAQGRALIQQGDVVGGLKCLDETMLAVVRGELGPIMTGLMYCSVIDTCRQVYALERAGEWISAFSRFCEQQPEMAAFTGTCLVHRAEIMQLQGAWAEALAEARRACERAQRADRKPPGAALYQQAEIHRLRGEFEKAEDAYRAASELGFEPQPGLALLRLAQGRADAGNKAIRRLMSGASDENLSVFPQRRLRRAGVLPAQFEIMLASGDLEEARRARDQLRELANACDTDLLRAVVAQADGAIAIAEGRPHAALDPLRRAFSLWERLDAPYEAARVRVLIADACRALGDDEAAGLEVEAARRVFERLGARPDLVRLDAPSARPPSPSKPVLTARELHVLRLISTGRTNKEIGEELSLSERTIDRHVTNILNKLAVRSRTAATTYAFDHKLF